MYNTRHSCFSKHLLFPQKSFFWLHLHRFFWFEKSNQLHQFRVKKNFPWKFNLEYGGTFTKLFMHVSSRNMFPTISNLQIRVHVYRPRHCVVINWLTFGCFVPMIHWGKADDRNCNYGHPKMADVESGKNLFCRLNCFYNVF
jgi:hypothetical protein